MVIEAPEALFITHGFGAYEEDGKIHVDVLSYPDAKIYSNYTFVQEAIYSNEYPNMKVARYTLDLDSMTSTGLHNEGFLLDQCQQQKMYPFQ